MIARQSISALAAFALCCGTALAAPLLKADIVVTAPIVTVGDMFEDAGLLAEEALFRSPLPGTTGNVDLAAIRAATARIGFTQFETDGLAAVRVSRAAAVIDQSILSALIEEDMRGRGILTAGMNADVQFSGFIDPLRAAASDRPVRLDSLRYLPGNGTFSVRFLLDGVDRPLDLTGSVAISVDTPHLAAALPAGTVLRPDHLVLRPVPVQQADAQGAASLDQLIGKALNRQSREGMLVRASDVSVPLTVAKNDIVTIIYRNGPMTLTVKGQAVTGAAQGAPLQVLNLISRRVIAATAIAPGVVEVSAAPITLAGL